MKSEELKIKLHQYIDKATDEELINILSFVEEDPAPYIVENKYDPWEDKKFVKEMDKRMEELESGKVKGIPWEEVHERVFNKQKNKNRK
jgi:hypothetical protein